MAKIKSPCLTEQYRLPKPALITTPEAWQWMMDSLRGWPVVAFDTESNSLYAYRERVCLIQISTPATDYLVDPLVLPDLSDLGTIFADPEVEKVFHAAEYDIMCLKRDFGFEIASLFDTMWAARILGWPRVGLGDILFELFGVQCDKRYQRYNWGERPLRPEALVYAQIDTHYLLSLRDLQREALLLHDRLEEAQDVFAEVAATPANQARALNAEGVWHIKGVFDLPARAQAVLSELHQWREEQAQRADRPPFKVLSDPALVAIARLQPHNKQELVSASGLKPHQVERYGTPILRAVERGRVAPLPSPPAPPPRPDDAVLARYEALREWRKRTSAVRGVDPDVVLPNAVLWDLARLKPRHVEELEQIERLGPWKRGNYGADIVRVLRSAK